MTEIGVVVHGPEIVDSGSARKLIDYLKRLGNVTAILGGTMGRLAILDAGLEEIIDISHSIKPSKSVQYLEPKSDFIFILNQAKSRETGLAFGSKVAAIARASKPLIQIDCGGRFVASLTEGADDLITIIANNLGLDILGSPVFDGAVREGNSVKRSLAGVIPGEPISVNGTVVGNATKRLVELETRNCRIIGVRGAKIKPHGLEKLSNVDLEKATLRSGNIRRTEAKPRLLERKGYGAALIDHCAEGAFEASQGACIVVTVGDDTTAIAGDILARLGVQVIGLVDGDLDQLARKTIMSKGSIVIKVKSGHDDLVGKLVKEEIFQGGSRASISPGELTKKVLKIATDHIVQVERI